MDYSKLTKEEIIKGIKDYSSSIRFKDLSEELKNDKDIALIAIKKNPHTLEHVSKRLSDDKELVLIAVQQNGYTLEYASERLRDDKKVVLEAIKETSLSFFYASERLKDNKALLLEAVKNRPYTLNFASERLQNDKDVLESIENTDVSYWNDEYKIWYENQMGVLVNIREKELMEKSITHNNIKSKKVKF